MLGNSLRIRRGIVGGNVRGDQIRPGIFEPNEASIGNRTDNYLNCQDWICDRFVFGSDAPPLSMLKTASSSRINAPIRGHLASNIGGERSDKNGRSTCVVCKTDNIRDQAGNHYRTSFECIRCGVPLCARPQRHLRREGNSEVDASCFEVWHAGWRSKGLDKSDEHP